MKSRYLQTVSTVAMGSIVLGAAMVKKAEAQDAGYSFSFSGGIGEASGLTFESGGFATSDPGSFGAVVVSRPFGDIEGSVGLSFYNQEARNIGSGYTGPSGGGGNVYGRNFTSWTAVDIMTSRQTSTPGFSWGAGLRAMKAEQGSAVGADGISGESGGFANYNFELGGRSSFVGLGPRVSARYATVPVAGKFGFSGEAGLSALFGQHKQEAFGSFSVDGVQVGSSGGSVELTDNFLATLDLALQADYHLSDSTKIFAGVQVQQFLNFADEFDADSARTESVFMGFKTEF
jgi:hypothetical protein